MGRIRRATSRTLGLTAALALVGAAPAVGAPTAEHPSKWELVDIGQRTCVTSDFGHPGQYFLVPLRGYWTTPLEVGTRNLPPGSSPQPTTIAPAERYHEDHVLEGVMSPLAPAPVGVYTAEVWASDGRTTQAVPITITFEERCY
ncbi:hypothetical protein JOF41_006732 [Saccharothrix coeruleofusca]|uniref:DUF5980 family protein n=1 Tax=Saccharothrix coeruleofusca TaxID=33919 RepID=UPI001AE5871B|nr:DUF5980 family protein [Saccharothrix coeruleofusca]MBP2340554.1 hypothetical protein [Saccharothrix coeruleofusca]